MASYKRKLLDVRSLLRREPTLRSIGGGYGFTLRVLNEGQHWEFKLEGRLIEWWPSTGRYMVNKGINRHERLDSEESLRRLLGMASP
jgi:hypothetical protein